MGQFLCFFSSFSIFSIRYRMHWRILQNVCLLNTNLILDCYSSITLFKANKGYVVEFLKVFFSPSVYLRLWCLIWSSTSCNIRFRFSWFYWFVIRVQRIYFLFNFYKAHTFFFVFFNSKKNLFSYIFYSRPPFFAKLTFRKFKLSNWPFFVRIFSED